MRDMNVLSLFDGMACGRIALERAGFDIHKYYACEVDKHAIKVAMDNYPDIIQLGDIKQWKKWDIDLSKIDLVLAGSPCQGFSYAGKREGLEHDGSKLFYKFHEILSKIYELRGHTYFLLENVEMLQKDLNIITAMMGINPIKINSKAFSAQNRSRMYWTNIYTKSLLFGHECCDIRTPEEKDIRLNDIVESNVPDKYFLTSEQKKRVFKNARGDGFNKYIFHERPKRKIYQLNNASDRNGFGSPGEENRIYDSRGLSRTLTTSHTNDLKIYHNGKIRKITPVEAERLQTVPDNYTDCVSETQRYKMLGNGWTVDVIAHILSYLNLEK